MVDYRWRGRWDCRVGWYWRGKGSLGAETCPWQVYAVGGILGQGRMWLEGLMGRQNACENTHVRQ